MRNLPNTLGNVLCSQPGLFYWVSSGWEQSTFPRVLGRLGNIPIESHEGGSEKLGDVLNTEADFALLWIIRVHVQAHTGQRDVAFNE